jgi:hypothetical protein
MKTMNGGWRLVSKLCPKPWTTVPPERIRPCDVQKLINSLKLREAYGIDGISNKCLRHFPRSLVHLTHLFNHCLRLLRATGYRLDDRGYRVRFRRELGMFLFTAASRTALVHIQPPIQLVPRVLSLGVKRPGLEPDHSPPTSAEVKE